MKTPQLCLYSSIQIDIVAMSHRFFAPSNLGRNKTYRPTSPVAFSPKSLPRSSVVQSGSTRQMYTQAIDRQLSTSDLRSIYVHCACVHVYYTSTPRHPSSTSGVHTPRGRHVAPPCGRISLSRGRKDRSYFVLYYFSAILPYWWWWW